MPASFRLILDPPRSATLNMALDEVLAHAQSDVDAIPCLRFYRWKQPAVTVGYFGDVEKTVKRFDAEKKELAVVRRLTGGGAVHHGKDLTFSLCSKLPSPYFPTDVKNSYLKINEAVRLGLKSRYPDIDYADCRTVPFISSRQKERVCFDMPSCYDLLSGGKKILGASQRRIGKIMLHQSTLFLDEDFMDLAQMIAQGFRELWKIEFEEISMTDGEMQSAGEVERARYGAREWAYLPGSFLREAIFFS